MALYMLSLEDQYTDLLEEFKDEFLWNSGMLHQSFNALVTAQQLQETANHELERQSLNYAIGQWLMPYHKHLVHAWTDQFFNCGTTTTSRLEGAHSVLKGWIGKPTKDLTRVWESIQLAISDQLNQIGVKRDQQSQGTPAGLSGVVFHQIMNKISHYGLYRFAEQYKLIRQQVNTTCTKTFQSSMGFPCWHIVKERLELGQGIYSTPNL